MASIFLRDVPLIGQPNGDTCWLTSAEMIYEYFHDGAPKLNETPVFGPRKFLKEYRNSTEGKQYLNDLTDMFFARKGLPPGEVNKLKCYGMAVVQPPQMPGTWEIPMLINLLAGYGPLFAGGNWGGGFKHAIVIIGACTTAERVYYNDPLPEGQGSIKYWTESTMKARLAASKQSSVLAFTNGLLEANEFAAVPASVTTRFPVANTAPANAAAG